MHGKRERKEGRVGERGMEEEVDNPLAEWSVGGLAVVINVEGLRGPEGGLQESGHGNG